MARRGTDSYTKRPRTPNDQYTEMKEEQIKNVKRVCKELYQNIQSVLFTCSAF